MRDIRDLGVGDKIKICEEELSNLLDSNPDILNFDIILHKYIKFRIENFELEGQEFIDRLEKYIENFKK
jgi:hypothetical protein